VHRRREELEGAAEVLAEGEALVLQARVAGREVGDGLVRRFDQLRRRSRLAERGAYLDSTMAHFDARTDQILVQAPTLTRSTAWLLGARAVVLTASISGVRSTRYAPDVEPTERRRALFEWTLEAFLNGAAVLIERGAVPQFETTSDQDWARL
jgi:hypothetical protein